MFYTILIANYNLLKFYRMLYSSIVKYNEQKYIVWSMFFHQKGFYSILYTIVAINIFKLFG